MNSTIISKIENLPRKVIKENKPKPNETVYGKSNDNINI